ncbi:hypothetical protein DFH07DRAFT_543048 [Mycena maculata]|uniref:Uncharacterized protein n=1 Tax=Mycena maculata TaxID=230809 RepID=A0AAD7N9J3_9AGAR|nr:hypothetical protein DFH07DRAFT_543048 [Mycena maculata]
MSNPGLLKLLGGLLFPVDLVMIVLQGLKLLTSNMIVLSRARLLSDLIFFLGTPHRRFKRSDAIVPSTSSSQSRQAFSSLPCWFVVRMFYPFFQLSQNCPLNLLRQWYPFCRPVPSIRYFIHDQKRPGTRSF